MMVSIKNGIQITVEKILTEDKSFSKEFIEHYYEYADGLKLTQPCGTILL